MFKKIVLKSLALVVCIFSIYIIIAGNFTLLYIILGTFGLIAGAVINIYSSPKSFNGSVASQRQIPNPKNLSTEDICMAFLNVDSSFGKPWMSKIGVMKQDCVIWGPIESGEYMYVFKMGNALYVTAGSEPAAINAREEDAWRLEKPVRNIDFFDDESLVCYSFFNHTLLDDFHTAIQNYVQTGVASALPLFQSSGKIYRFNENFTLKGQDFTVSDFDGNELYECSGFIPLKTFKIKYIPTGEEIFRITKRIIDILPKYDFYSNGEKYGRFKKKLIFSHDKFVMQTKDGKLEMKSLNDKLGENYVVTMDNKSIGTIAKRFTLSAHNIIFDNYIIYVTDEKFVPLLCALGVMAAREQRRDEV